MKPDSDPEDLQPPAYEALIQFLYQAPIGLLQIRPDGTVTMMNPRSAQLLMPLARQGNLDNLFEVLDEVAPDLRAMADAAGDDDDPVGSVATADVAGVLGKKPQSLSPARDSLLKKGLIYSGERGRIAFTVPHFGRYLRTQA